MYIRLYSQNVGEPGIYQCKEHDINRHKFNYKTFPSHFAVKCNSNTSRI